MATRLLVKDVRKRLASLMKPGTGVLAAVAYVTDVSGLPLGAGDTLVCNAGDQAAENGSTSKKALRELVERGVAVRSSADLHAKVVVAGGRAVIGSSNWSANSSENLIEANLDTDDPAVVRAAAAFVRAQAKSAVTVDEAFLDAMPEVERGSSGGSGGKLSDVPEGPPRAWIVNGYPLPATDEYEPFRAKADSQIKSLKKVVSKVATFDWIWWGEENDYGTRIRKDELLVLIWKPDADTVEVYPPVQMIDRVNGEHAIIYVGARNHNQRAIPWTVFKSLAAEIGLPANMTPNTNRELSKEKVDLLLERWPKTRRT